MRLLETQPHPSERPGFEARKNAKKVIEGIEDTIRRQSTVKTLPCVVNVAGGGETKKSELKENTGAKTRETKVKTLPQATIVAVGVREMAQTNTKWKGGTTHSPARGGTCLAENA